MAQVHRLYLWLIIENTQYNLREAIAKKTEVDKMRASIEQNTVRVHSLQMNHLLHQHHLLVARKEEFK